MFTALRNTAPATLMRKSARYTARTSQPENNQRIANALSVLGLLLVTVSAAADRGALNPDVTQDTIGQTICVPGYAKNMRPASRGEIPH
jgi:hypothetical protein